MSNPGKMFSESLNCCSLTEWFVGFNLEFMMTGVGHKVWNFQLFALIFLGYKYY